MIQAGSKICVKGSTRSIVAGIEASNEDSKSVFVTIRPVFDLENCEMFVPPDTELTLDQGAFHRIEDGDPIWRILLGVRANNDGMEPFSCASPDYGPVDVPLFIDDVLAMRGDFSVSGRVTAINKPITIRDWTGNCVELTGAIEVELEKSSEVLVGQAGRIFDDTLGRPVGVLTSGYGQRAFLAPIRPFANFHSITICDVLSSNYANLIGSLNEGPVIQLAEYADG